MHASVPRRHHARIWLVLPMVVAATFASPRIPSVEAAGSTATTTVLQTSANPSTFGGGATFTATVTASDSSVPTGSVVFTTGDGTPVGAATLGPAAPGVASVTTAALPGGNNSIVAAYAGDAAHAASSSSPLDQVVDPVGTTLTVSSSRDPSAPGASVVLWAALEPATTRSSLSFSSDPGDPIGAGLNGAFTDATATFAHNPNGAGTSPFDLSVQPSGGSLWSVFLSAPQGQPLQPGTYTGVQRLSSATAPALNVSANGRGCTTTSGSFTVTSVDLAGGNYVRGLDATFVQYCDGSTAALHGTVHYSGAKDPTGTITFHDGSTWLGSASPQGLVASMNTAGLAAGDHQITATYSGDASYAASTSPALMQHVSAVSPSVSISVSTAEPVDGTAVTLAASVSVPSGNVAPTGTVTFVDTIRSDLGWSAPLDPSGHAALTVTNVPSGSSDISAVYGGDAEYPTVTSLAVAVDSVPPYPAMGLAVSPSPYVAGEPVTLTVGSGFWGATPQPTGTVTFSDGGSALGSAIFDATGVAALHLASLAYGPHQLGARYGGDSVWHAAVGTLTLTAQSATVIGLGLSTDPSVPNQPVVLAAAVSSTVGRLPSGSVTLSDDGTVLGTFPLDASGTATVALPYRTAGQHEITAQFSGSGNFASSSATYSQTVADALPNRRFVNQLYNDILARPATDADASPWVSLLDRNAIDRTHVALALTTSTEFISNQVDETYLARLGRDADPQGLAFWVEYIQHGATFEDLQVSFLGTPEYYAGAPARFPNLGLTPAQAFVYAVYNDVLGRDPDSGGLAYWVRQLSGGDSAWHLAASLVKSYEAMSIRVTNDYQLLLGRDPDAPGRDAWVAQLLHGTRDETLLAELAGSTEYWNDTQAY